MDDQPSLTIVAGLHPAQDRAGRNGWRAFRRSVGARLHLTVTQKIYLTFGLALAVLLAVVTVAVRSQRNFVASTEAVRHSHEVIDELEKIPMLLTAVESSRRGYILTGDRRLLQSYEAAVVQLPPALESVRRLTAREPGQQQRLDQLEPVLAQKLALLHNSIILRRRGGTDVDQQRAITIESQPLSQTIHAISTALVANERLLLGEYSARSDAHARAMEILLLITGGLGIITLWLAGAEVRRDILDRDRARAELDQINATLEARVTARTAELQAASQELEAFSYSVSHDLRAPLRAIDGFSKILGTKHADQLTSEAREALHLVRTNTQQMGQLIDDLLSFAQLNRQPLKKETVHPTTLVSAILAELRTVQENQPGEIIVEDLPACPADPGLLRVVWTNLLSNAFKYTRKRDGARIEIGALRPDEWRWTQDTSGEASSLPVPASRLARHASPIYFVRDNGVGFNMAYADKIFGVFQRLHRAEDYEGTGVGLATVQRIIQRHGGCIWAEAELNNGATFYFTLEPARTAAPAELPARTRTVERAVPDAKGLLTA